jgi:hypothetical protein
MATTTEVQRLFEQYGVPTSYTDSGSTGETSAQRIARITNEINSGTRTWDQVISSVSRLASTGSMYNYAPIEDRISQVFESYGVPLDYHSSGGQEDPQVRLARIAQEVQSGQRTFQSVIDSVQRLAMSSGPRTPQGGEEAPTTDFAAEAAAMFPWLTGQLLSLYAGFWADTGSPSAALTKLRNTSQYSQVFQGIRRPDGTLRMDENAYWSTKVGFREALAEHGRNPANYEAQFVKLFENEVGADEFFRTMADGHQRFIEPGSAIDNGLFDAFINGFIGSGSAITALQTVRESSAYDTVFEGNRREDGTIRMEEADWFAYKRGWQRTLAGFGLDPTEFQARNRLRESVEGEISIQELNQRLQVTQDGILDNIDAVRQFYGQAYGIELTTEAILGMAIDPDIQRDVLERRITAGQIGGEAAVAGFARNIERAEELARAGLEQAQARELYAGAAMNLRGISGATSRFHLGGTDIGNYESAVAFQDAIQQRRFQTALQREESSFSSTMDTRQDRDSLGLTGLRQR